MGNFNFPKYVLTYIKILGPQVNLKEPEYYIYVYFWKKYGDTR